jgi:hypothetical protein
VIKKQREQEWIHTKRGYRSSQVWLAFKPESKLQFTISNQDKGIQVYNGYNKYYYLLNNYYTILDSIDNIPGVNCKLEITPEPELSHTQIPPKSSQQQPPPTTVEAAKKPDPNNGNTLLQAAYESLKYNQTSGIRYNEFYKDIYPVSGVKNYEDLAAIQEDLQRKGFITYNITKKIITPTPKLLNLFNSADINIMEV